jgi:D-sedoheptulose 7-phosphate isomerase
MKAKVGAIAQELKRRYPELEACSADLRAAYHRLETCFASGGKLLVCGNGGSAADVEHIVGELMKGFMLKRPLGPESLAALEKVMPKSWRSFADGLQGALPALSLVGQPAFANDAAPDMAFAQAVFGYGRAGDVLLALSTSGNSRNVLNAALAAKAFGLGVVALTGRGGGELGRIAEVCVRAPADETYRVQELHLPIYHALCAMLEENFFGDA